MNRFISATLAAAATIFISPAKAQNVATTMQAFDLQVRGVYKAPPVELWKDMLQVQNSKFRREADADTLTGGTTDQFVPGMVFFRQFKVGQHTVTATILSVKGECHPGPDAPKWAPGCPVKISISKDEEVRVVEGRACAPQRWSDNLRDPFGGDRAFSAYDPASKAILFNITDEGKILEACTSAIPIGL